MTYRDSRTKPLNMRVGTEVHQLLYEKLCEVNPNTSHVPAHNIRFYDPYLADYEYHGFNDVGTHNIDVNSMPELMKVLDGYGLRSNDLLAGLGPVFDFGEDNSGGDDGVVEKELSPAMKTLDLRKRSTGYSPPGKMRRRDLAHEFTHPGGYSQVQSNRQDQRGAGGLAQSYPPQGMQSLYSSHPHRNQFHATTQPELYHYQVPEPEGPRYSGYERAPYGSNRGSSGPLQSAHHESSQYSHYNPCQYPQPNSSVDGNYTRQHLHSAYSSTDSHGSSHHASLSHQALDYTGKYGPADQIPRQPDSRTGPLDLDSTDGPSHGFRPTASTQVLKSNGPSPSSQAMDYTGKYGPADQTPRQPDSRSGPLDSASTAFNSTGKNQTQSKYGPADQTPRQPDSRSGPLDSASTGKNLPLSIEVLVTPHLTVFLKPSGNVSEYLQDSTPRESSWAVMC
ncbi:hypothetical protein THAOC_06930, partial [Thalassiosira oceanica]